MPFHPAVLDDLAKAGVNIVIDAMTTDPDRLSAVVRLWDRGSGSVTIKNAGGMDARALVAIAQALGGRVTFEE